MLTTTEVAQLTPVSNQEILDACTKMELEERITFIPNHEFARFELSSLVMSITQHRKKEGLISLYKTQSENGWQIVAHCYKQIGLRVF